VQTAQSVRTNPSILADVDVILSGWGMAVLDETLLAAAPKLKAIFYGAGSIRHFVTDAMWERGIVVTTAAQANAIPVAEFTIAAIVMSLKQVWRLQREVREQRCFVARNTVIGVYRQHGRADWTGHDRADGCRTAARIRRAYACPRPACDDQRRC
jgi:phosphoglycerate dehydrogenase-like enzyme